MKIKRTGATSSFNRKQANVELINTFGENLERQIQMCKKLENFADRLPDMVDATECRPLANEIIECLKLAQEYEESVLFPILKKRFCENTQIENTLERLRFEHLEDESFAQELKICLEEFSAFRRPANADLLGYMLRGFFEGVRRHTAFEREHLLPMLEMNAV